MSSPRAGDALTQPVMLSSAAGGRRPAPASRSRPLAWSWNDLATSPPPRPSAASAPCAEAVAIALAHHLGFRVIGEAHHGSGSDWLMVPKGEPATDFYMLEVSGIIRKTSESPLGRLHAKVTQGREGDLGRPGMAVVVRFEDVRVLSETWR